MAQRGSERERIAKDKGKGGPCRFRRAPRIVLRKSPTLLQLSYLSKLSTHRDASSAQNVVFPVPGVPVTRMFAAEDISTDETLELSRSVVLLNIISIYFISTSLDRAPLARVLKRMVLLLQLQLANANFDAIGAFAQLLPATTGWSEHSWTFTDADHLISLIPSILACMKEAPDEQVLLFVHTHLVTDKRTKNQGDFVLEMGSKSRRDPRAVADGYAHRCTVCNASGNLLLCNGLQCGNCAHRKCAAGLALVADSSRPFAATTTQSTTPTSSATSSPWYCPKCTSSCRTAAGGSNAAMQTRATVTPPTVPKHRQQYPSEIYECASAYSPHCFLHTLLEPVAAAVSKRRSQASTSKCIRVSLLNHKKKGIPHTHRSVLGVTNVRAHTRARTLSLSLSLSHILRLC